MYNEERKTQFILAYTQDARNQKFCHQLFGKTGKFERESQCDIAQMTQTDAQRALNQICGASASSIRNTLTILRAYTKWCEEQGFPVNDHLFSIEVSACDAVRADYVASPMHLARSLAVVFPEPEISNVQYLCRAYLWLAFMGLQENEAARVTAGDIDFDRMIITLTPSAWHTYRIHSEAVHDIKMAATMQSIRSKVGRGYAVLDRHPGSEILRTTSDGKGIMDMVVKTIRPSVSRAGKAARETASSDQGYGAGACLNPTYMHILQSGIFYRTYEEERLGITPGFTKYAELDVTSRIRDDGTRETRRKIDSAISDTRRRLEQEYARWKNVYVV